MPKKKVSKTSGVVLREATDVCLVNNDVCRLKVIGPQWRCGKYWRCVCECSCGTVVCVMVNDLGKKTMSCGCLFRERAVESQRRMIARRTASGEYRPPEDRVSNCERCGTAYYKAPNAASSRYCSLACRSPGHDERRELVCEECGSQFTAQKSHRKWPRFCQRSCYEKRILAAVGDQSIHWRGGTTTFAASGFVMLYQDPHAPSYRAEHRVVVERVLGRSLTKHSEPIIHLNGIAHDNRPENLYVFPTHSEMQIARVRGELPEKSNIV